MKPNWIKIQTEPGKQENAMKWETLPVGPFMLVPQHDMEKFEKDPFHYQGGIVIKSFEVKWGYSTYAMAEDFQTPVLVGHHWDCS